MTSTQAAQLAAGTWTIDINHSLIEFAARHNEIAYVKGRFRKFAGTIEVNAEDLLKSTVDLTIDVTSVDSQAVQGREDLIKGEEMLDTAKWPEITFRSTSIQQKDLANYVIAGDLTVRGTTRRYEVPVTFNGIVVTRMGPAAGFSGNLTVKLSDFGVPFTREFEPGRRVVGDDLRVELEIEAKPQS
jgi:polyisoprenoid-binding protein YceI